MTQQKKNRREFIQATASAAVLVGASTNPILAEQRMVSGGIPTRPLGKTGVHIPILGLGGWHIGSVEGSEAIRIMHASIDQGLTFFDNAWDYHDGGSEEIMGKALANGKRKDVFLMTKNCERDYEGSMRNLEESLKRLQTDHIDLWQFHEIIYDNAPDWVFEKGGLKAALEARQQGKVRFIGFTGHKDPRIHLKMLGKPHDWDAVQMPINVLDAHYRSFQREVVPVCEKRGIGVLGMKSLGGSSPGAIVANTDLTASELRRYALSLPISSLVSGITSMEELEQDLNVARDFKPMGAQEMAAMEASVKDIAGDGRLERFKSSQNYDGRHHREQHGFG